MAYWIETLYNNWICSECHKASCDDYYAQGTPNNYIFCPHCGSKMSEPTVYVTDKFKEKET
jgi:DNA-directed RNA polymerase subunit RPC12/RpoP